METFEQPQDHRLPATERAGSRTDERNHGRADRLDRALRQEARMSTTLCWNCSHEHPAMLDRCPKCGSTNPNINFTAALVEWSGDDVSLRV